MTDAQKIRYAFDSGYLSLIEKLMLVFFYWTLGGITNDQAISFFAECGYTFTPPTTTGVTILTGGKTYTVVSLVTEFHDTAYPSTIIGPFAAQEMLKALKSKGFILDSELTQLKGLGW